MESANLHLHDNNKVEEQFAKYSSDLFTQTGHQVSDTDEWNPNHQLSPINTGRNLTEIIPKSRDLWPPPLIRSANSMNQDSSFNQQSGASFHESDSFPNSHSSTTAEDSYLLSKRYYDQYYLGEGNLWHTNFSNIANNNMAQLQLSSSGDLYTNIADHDHHSPCLGTSAAASRSYDLNHIFPSTTSYLSSTLFSSSLDLNLKTLDLLTSTYDGGISCNNQSLIDSHGKLSRSLMSHDHRRERRDSPSTSYKVSTFVSGPITSTKRPGGSFSETKESHSTDAYKKHRSSRSSCPTLKVRKEKLGDRVAALQKLVAPFGKTDTATVLTEAIGYIQFLHDQVQTLSVPFMKSSQSDFHRTEKVGSRDQEQEQKRDLRSRGLCLVPQSCASYFINTCSTEI